MNDHTTTTPGSEWMTDHFAMAPARIRGPLLVASGIVATAYDPDDD